MNTAQRLLSNTAIAFAANVLTKAGTALLFIAVGRVLGPTESGMFSLGTTWFTIVFGLSAVGLHEVMVREVAPRRDESRRYLVNFLALRVFLSLITYALLLFGLWLVNPYSPETTQVILIVALAALPEGAFTILQSLFEAHERLGILLVAATVNLVFKLGVGLWLLFSGASIVELVWVVPAATTISLLVFIPGLFRLFRQVPQASSGRLDLPFVRGHLTHLPSFFVIHVLALLDFQADALIISIMLGEEQLGYYAAAQTILLAFNLMPTAIRAALYPLMSRYYKEAPDKLALLYNKVSKYIAALVLPLATGLTLLAGPIIELVYGPDFTPAVAVLQITIWAIVFLFLVEPHARMLLVHNKQRQAAWMMTLATVLNIILNLLLIPAVGINGAAIARLISSLTLYLLFYAYCHFTIMPSKQPFSFRVILATLIMALAVLPLRDLFLLIPIVVGILVYLGAVRLLGGIPDRDLAYWREIYGKKG